MAVHQITIHIQTLNKTIKQDDEVKAYLSCSKKYGTVSEVILIFLIRTIFDIIDQK
jgi:hypothetical protein